jgi:hypothetical protein
VFAILLLFFQLASDVSVALSGSSKVVGYGMLPKVVPLNMSGQRNRWRRFRTFTRTARAKSMIP